MARKPAHIQDLAAQIEALEPDDQLAVIKRVLTPQMELRLAMDQIAARARHVPARALDRAIDRTVREVRRERAARSPR
jgi:hypothetical protein